MSSLKDIYNALKSDGQFTQTKDYDTFARRMNERGYSQQIYKNLQDAGATLPDIGTFRKRLGVHVWTVDESKAQIARNNAAAQKRSTPLSRAQKNVANDMWGTNAQASAQSSQDSELVHFLKAGQQAETPIDYTKPTAVKQIIGQERQRQQKLGEHAEYAGRVAASAERRRREQPAFDTGNADVNNSIVKTQGQLEDEMEKSGRDFTDQNFGAYIANSIFGERKAAEGQGSRNAVALSQASPFAYMAADLAYNKEIDPEKLLKRLTEKVQGDTVSLFSKEGMQERIAHESAYYNMSPDEYVQKVLAPSLQQKVAEEFDKSELAREMPKNTAEYILRGVNDSLLGTIAQMATTTRSQREYNQRAMGLTDEGQNPYMDKPGMWTKAGRGAVSFLADAPAFGPLGKAGMAVAGRVLGSGMTTAMRMANTSLAGRIGRMAAQGAVSQGVTGALYGSINTAVQNYSTGDDTSIGNTVKLMLKGGLSEGASWATMGGMGGVVGGQIYNASGAKRLLAKGYQVAMEGVGMHFGGNVAKTIEGEDTDWLSVEGNLQDVANVVALKLGHGLPKRATVGGKKEGYLDFVARNLKSAMTSDATKAKAQGLVFTEEEKRQLFGSEYAPKRRKLRLTGDEYRQTGDNEVTFVPGENLHESLTHWAMRTKRSKAKANGEESYKDTDVEFVKTAYDQIMADNSIPWDTKAKFSALVMGTTPSARPMMYYGRVEKDADGDFMAEYGKYGELLSKTYYKTSDERAAISYRLSARRENQRLQNAYGAAQIKDEAGAEAVLAFVGESHGLTAEQLKKAMEKDPLRRTDEEQKACIDLREAYENEQFKPGTLHAEQSELQGNDAVEANGLGTERPNNEAVVEVMNDLTKAENALQEAMDGNDVLKQEYDRLSKQGMSNAQIYQELINSGVTQDELVPLADYINANAKAQGMFRGTQQKIDETVQQRVADWGYKGNLNGEKADGENFVYVTDDKGRTLIVGAGDIAFGSDGRATEGDMITVLDTATGEMDFVSAKDVKLLRTESSEDYANAFRQHLQKVNSEGYGVAAEAQANMELSKTEETNILPGDAADNSMENTKTEEPSNKTVNKSDDNGVGEWYTNLRLSGELDQNDSPFVLSPNGNVDFGEISSSQNLPAAPVRLSMGNMENGYIHINRRHGKQIKKAGFNSIESFVEYVVNNFTRIKEGATYDNERGGKNQTYLLQLQDGHNNTLFVQLSRDGKYWNVNSAGIFGKKYGDKKKDVWSASEVQNGNSAVVSDGSQSEPIAENGSTSNGTPSKSFKEEHTRQTTGKQPVEVAEELRDSEQSDTQKTPRLVDNSASSLGKDSESYSNGNAPKQTLTFDDGSPIEFDKKGNAVYEKTTPENTVSDLFGRLHLENDEASDFVAAKRKKAEDTLKKLEGKKPKMGDDISKYQKEKTTWQEKMDFAKKSAEHWDKVAEEIERITTPDDAKGWQEELSGEAAHEEYEKNKGKGNETPTAEDLAAQFVSGSKITSESFKKETGFGNDEMKKLVGLISNKDGKSIERLGEELVELDNNEYGGMVFHGDSNAARDAIIDALMSAKSKGDLKNRMTDAEKEFTEQRNADRDKAFMEKYHMSYEDYVKASEQELPELLRKAGWQDEALETMVDELRYMKTQDARHEADKRREAVLRDTLADLMKKNGLDVSMSAEEGQRVLDEANGNVQMSAKKRRALETVSVSRNVDEEHPQTAISSADGAKVLKNLDTLANDYENSSSTNEKTFIGEIANSLGINAPDKSSKYATFETKNGKVVTIRLSNHNAKVSNFDANGEADGISIVVSPKKSEGITNDGDAHVTEYYYDSIKLRKAEGKPLAEVVKSIKQLLYSGEFKDPTGLAEVQEVNVNGPRFFRTADGEAYGFTVGGKIYIDPRVTNSETPIHEYAHLWASALKRGNPKEWQNVVDLMLDTKVWDEVERNYPELKGNVDAIADEVIATYSGRRGAERLRKMADEVPAGKAFDKAKALGTIDKVKRALDKFWHGVADMLHIHYTSAEEVADRVMKDLLDGVDPRKAMKDAVEENMGDAPTRFQKVTDKEELEKLDKEKTFRMYSGMQVIDGELYSPMAAVMDGKRTEPTEMGAWMKADERPDLVKNGKFNLIKTDKAKDAVGLVPWHSGSVNGLLPKDRQRSVMLSRWRKAVRVVPDAEVAEGIAKQLEGTDLAIPWNVVTPNQLKELAKLGVRITTEETGKQAPETKEAFLKQKAELEKEYPQAKFVDVKMTKDAYKEWGNGSVKKAAKKKPTANPIEGMERAAEAWREEQKVRLQKAPKEKEGKSDELFLSLQNKKGKEYYDTVDILSERVADGRAEIRGISLGAGPKAEERVTAMSAGIEIIAASRDRQNESGAAKSNETKLRLGRLATEKAVEEWARGKNAVFDEDDIAKESKDGKPCAEGGEAVVYVAKDFSKVTKLVDPYPRNKGSLQLCMENTRLFNQLFPETTYTVKGVARDKNGKFRIVMEQPYLDGKQYTEDTLAEYENGPSQAKDALMESLGLHDVYGDGLEFKNDKYYVSDVHFGNVVFDSDGKPHIIDADVKYYGVFRRENIEGKPMIEDKETKTDTRSTEELFESLKDKEGGDYYDTVTELARRVSEGKARFTRLPKEYELRGVLSPQQAAARAIASAWLQNSEGRGTSIGGRTNNTGLSDVQLGKERRIYSCEVQIETWAKQNGCWINEEDYSTKDYKQNHSGSESVVYFVGNKVVKFTSYDTLHRKEGVGGFLERITLMNAIDHEAALKVIGFSRDKEGTFKVVLEQKKFAKAFDLHIDENGDFTEESNELLEEWYENDAPKIKRQFARRGMRYSTDSLEATYKNDVVIQDLGTSNIACDEKGKYHIIDGNAHLLGDAKTGDWSIVDNSDVHYHTAEDVAQKTLPVNKVVDDIAREYGVDKEDVAQYAEGMKKGSSAQAWRAMAEIGRKIIAAHEGEIHSLLDMRKLKRPVENALKEKFGDVDKLVEERRKQVEAERNAMEAARKRTEEEEAKRKQHQEELSMLTTDEIDERYAEAIEKDDERTAREMLDEAARRKGYGDTDSEYQGVGAWEAPSNPGYESDEARRADVENNAPNVNLEDMALGYDLQPDGYFTHPERYSQNTPHGQESTRAIQAALDALKRGDKDVKVKVYRAVPTSVKEGSLRNGDWVTPSRKYAEMHGEHRLEGKYRIIEDEVPAKDLWWDGNDANEFGYDDGKAYKYKNAKNNRKLNDLVTRDDKGNVIPPSKRFNSRKSDVRYREDDSLDEVNRKFNERLDSLRADPNQKGGELHLGYPGKFLSDAGLGNSEIVLEYSKIARKSSEAYKNDHPFDTDDIKDLPKAINDPIAVFDNTNGDNAGKVILTELQKDGKNFIVAIRAAERRKKGGVVLEVNEIKTLFPKEARGIVNWLNTGKTSNVNKEKALAWLGNLRTHRGNLLTEQELSSAANIVNEFDITKQKPLNYRIGDNNLEKQNNPVDKAVERLTKIVEKTAGKLGVKVNTVRSVEEITTPQVRKDIESGKQVQGWYDEKTGEVHLYMPNIHCSRDAVKTVWHETVGHKGMRGLLGDKFGDYMRGLWMDLDNPANAELREYVRGRMAKEPMSMYDAIEEYLAEAAENGKGEPKFWNRIRNKVVDALREIGYRIQPNVKDVKYMLWLAKNVQKHPNDPVWKMRAEAVRWKIEHEDFEGTKIHGGELYENDGKSHDFADMTREEWLNATDGEIHYSTAPSTATALDRYHRALDAHGYMATEAFMDNMLSLKALMKAIDPSIKKIEDVASSMNPYLMQNVMEGAMSDRMKLFELRMMEPLDKAMANVLDAFEGKSVDDRTRDFNLYMIRKHGLERNRVLYVRDAVQKSGDEKLAADWSAEKERLGNELASGNIDLKEYYRQMDEWIRKNVDANYDASEHDYSGMHGLQEIADNTKPYDDAGAIDKVMSQEQSMESMKRGSVKDFWAKVKAATQFALDSDYQCGMVTKATHDRVSAMFDWYVPLRKFDDATAEDIYGYVTDSGVQKGSIGATLMSAKGRKSLSNVDILAQIGVMGNRAIKNGGANTIRQTFARFVRNNGGKGLVTETKVWVEKKGTDVNGNDIWEEAYPKIPDTATADDVAAIVDAFEADMKAKEKNGLAKSISDSSKIKFKFERAKDKAQHIVDVMIAGKTHRFIINGNPRAAQALNGMLENGGAKTGGGKVLQAITRWMAQTATSWNPEFVMRNIIRDAEFASSNVTAKEGARYGAVWSKYYAELTPLNILHNEGMGALKGLKWKDLKGGVGYGLYARYREGTLGNSKMERYFKEFMENGGETGFVQLKNLQDMAKEYKSTVSKEAAKGVKKGLINTGKVVHGFFENVEHLNEVAENMARFATFCASRDMGRSAARSAYDAKEVSTNFNRHGSGDAIKSFRNGEIGTIKEARRNTYGFLSSYLRNYSMFFNAGIQSTNLLLKNVKNSPVASIANMMAVPFAMGALAPLLNQWLMNDEDESERGGVKDPYAELPEYIRRNNLCIYTGKGNFVTIPLAIELRAFYGLGDLAAGQTFAQNVKSGRNVVMDGVGSVSQLFPVIDLLNSQNFDKEPVGEAVKGILPTGLSPFAEWALNSDWKGARIRREYNGSENVPAWKNAYNGTPDLLMRLNKSVNAATNDVAPGNENMKGNALLDAVTDPAMLNHIYGTLGGGSSTFAMRTGGMLVKTVLGKSDEVETKDIPFLRSIVYTPTEQSSMARTKAKWYSYKNDMAVDLANYDALKSKNVPLTERITNQAAIYKFEGSKKAQRIKIIKDADKQIKRWNDIQKRVAGDKKQVDFANRNKEMVMQRAVDQLDRIGD